jgi:hypothetical protein
VVFSASRLAISGATNRGITVASSASDTFDPVAAAEKDIAGSKVLIASVADDLSQHYRWLESYRASEKKAARRLKRREVMYQLELGRRRVVRLSKQLALFCFRLGLWASVLLVRWIGAGLTYSGDLLQRAAAWLIPRARALAFALASWTAAAFSWTCLHAIALARRAVKFATAALAVADRKAHAGAFKLGRWIGAISFWTAATAVATALILRTWLVAAFSWSRVNGAILARNTGMGISRGFSWIVLKSDTIGIAFRRKVAIGFARSRVKARNLSRSLFKELSIASRKAAAKSVTLSTALRKHVSMGASRAAARAEVLAFAFLKTALAAQFFLAERGRDIAMFGRRLASRPDTRQRALVLRPCTALICVEPWRARLPVARAG